MPVCRSPSPAPDPPRVRVVERMPASVAEQRAELIAGLRARPATIPPRYFYDALGCALFRAICELPEYYLTRAEQVIFDVHRSDIARAVGPGRQWVDLGAGDCAKGEAWIPIAVPSRYVAVDVARVAIEPALARIAAAHPDVEVAGVVTDFARGLDLHGELGNAPVLFFYPGSSIGNFTPGHAQRFLSEVRRHCRGRQGSGLLVGVDTKKDAATLVAAYDDALGVTAAFNRNVLHHVDRFLGCGFDPGAFSHRALYDERQGRIEMHLEATRGLAITLDGKSRRFAAGERIHTENSYKYAPPEFAALLHGAGFEGVRCWQDPAKAFAVFYAA